MSKIKSLHDILVEEIQDLYNAEVQLTKTLPKVAEAITDLEFKTAIEEHWEQTKGHVRRLEEAAQLLDVTPKSTTCHAMKGLLKEGGERIKTGKAGSGRDVGIICAAQKVEHYEMAGYGCVRAYAELLGLNEVASLLHATLIEEIAADQKLNELAQRINPTAESPAELRKAS